MNFKLNERLDRLRLEMDKEHLDAFLVTKAENIFYLSGFSGGADAQLVITADQQYIITDSRYYEQTARECPDWILLKKQGDGWDILRDLSGSFDRLAFEAHAVTVDYFEKMQAELSVSLLAKSALIESLRIVKDEQELNCLRQAARMGDLAFSQILSEIKAGMTEQYVAARIAFLLRELGCRKESFDTIAVSGPNAALPHGQPSSRVLSLGDMLTLDFGGFYQGYAGDMTRTIGIGEATPRFRDTYLRLLEAQQLGLSSVKAGVSGKEVDAAVRKCLRKWDLDAYFGHGLGHGVGLEIHEEPRLSPYSDLILEANMVVTVEPGVYIPGWGGIRIEDTVIVQSHGCEVITHSDKGLLTI